MKEKDVIITCNNIIMFFFPCDKFCAKMFYFRFEFNFINFRALIVSSGTTKIGGLCPPKLPVDQR